MQDLGIDLGFKYGAPELKKAYQKHLTIAEIVSIAVVLIIVGIYYLAEYLMQEEKPSRVVRIMKYSELGPPPTIQNSNVPPAISVASPAVSAAASGVRPSKGIPVPVPDNGESNSQLFTGVNSEDLPTEDSENPANNPKNEEESPFINPNISLGESEEGNGSLSGSGTEPGVFSGAVIDKNSSDTNEGSDGKIILDGGIPPSKDNKDWFKKNENKWREVEIDGGEFNRLLSDLFIKVEYLRNIQSPKRVRFRNIYIEIRPFSMLIYDYDNFDYQLKIPVKTTDKIYLFLRASIDNKEKVSQFDPLIEAQKIKALLQEMPIPK